PGPPPRRWRMLSRGLGRLMAWVCLPLDTLARHLRREPVLEARSETVDVARQLGRRPVGAGHHAFLAGLPGTEIFHIEYSEKTLCPQRLPAAWDGLTVLHVSDLHLHGTPDFDYFRGGWGRCGAGMPDLVAVTGDIVDSPTHHAWVSRLLGLLRWRVAAVAILGNHDHRYEPEPIRQELRALGMHVPGNGWMQLE